MIQTIKEKRDKDFIRENQGKYFCQCGCEQEIVIKPFHREEGIPDYIRGHNMTIFKNIPEEKEKQSKRMKKYFSIIKNRKSHSNQKIIYFQKFPKEKERVSKWSKEYNGIPEVKEATGKRLKNYWNDDKANKRQCERNLGSKNPAWLNGLSFEPYSKEFNDKFKRLIRKRDNYICLKCGKHQEKEKHSLSVHHVNYDKKLTIRENCCTVCNSCNSEVNKNREHWTKFFQSLLSEKYGYQYSDKCEVILKLKDEVIV